MAQKRISACCLGHIFKKDIWREHIWLISYVLFYALFVSITLGVTLDTPFIIKTSYTDIMARVTGQAALILAVIHTIKTIYYDRPHRPVSHLIPIYKKNFLAPDVLIRTALIISLIMLFTSAYSTFKAMIPFLIPYRFDPLFAEIDRLLHFGIDPWRLIHPYLSLPTITFLINVFYNIWLVVMYVFWLWMALKKDRPYLRMRFFMSYVVTWSLLGNIAALFLSSAGPVYYHHFVQDGADYFAPLTAYLEQADLVLKDHIWALDVQKLLWERYLEHSTEIGSGISAMPSMHVAMAFIYYLVARHICRPFAHMMLAYLIMIMVGSVHLGWHYAIDGYVSIVLTAIIWKSVGLLLKKDPYFQKDPYFTKDIPKEE